MYAIPINIIEHECLHFLSMITFYIVELIFNRVPVKLANIQFTYMSFHIYMLNGFSHFIILFFSKGRNLVVIHYTFHHDPKDVMFIFTTFLFCKFRKNLPILRIFKIVLRYAAQLYFFNTFKLS